MDISAIQAMIGSLKAATDVSKALFDLKTSAEVQSKVIDIQRALLAAQANALEATAAQATLQERVRDLEAVIKSFEDWGKQEQRYALVSPWGGPAQLYALKKEHAQGEAAHYLCTNCFHNRKRVIVNPTSNKEGWVYMTCPSCQGTSATGYRGVGAPKYAEDCVPNR
jgi:hypothetical protein